ncbi:MAG: hypothetical protein E7588_09135 [Ruminococcaceae bacterium]|nr:hypothetical protein [Oscillospiraceae bacterium]
MCSTRNRLITHFNTYNKAQIGDLFKFLHQSCFGCEHMISDYRDVLKRISEELEQKPRAKELIEVLDGDYSRVWLGFINNGMSRETFAKLFYLSSKCSKQSENLLEEKLAVLKRLISDGAIPLDKSEFEKAVQKWKSEGYPALHHSESFNKEYQPAYRVISNKFIPFTELFTRIDMLLSKGNAVVAIEGSAASGKTTLAKILGEVYDCTVFHMDDFFLQPHQRTPERFEQIGGNVDYERFHEEVLKPLNENKTVNYRRFDCTSMKMQPAVEIIPKKLTVIEGAYCMRPELSKYYNLSVFLNIDPEMQKKRILHRNPDMAQRFFDDWIPMEQRYFEAFDIKNKCNVCMEIQDN